MAHLQAVIDVRRDSAHRPDYPHLESAQREHSSDGQPFALNTCWIEPVDVSLTTVCGNDYVQGKKHGGGWIQRHSLQEQQWGVDAKNTTIYEIHPTLSARYVRYIVLSGYAQILMEQGVVN